AEDEPDPAKPETIPPCPGLSMEGGRVVPEPHPGLASTLCQRAGVRVGMTEAEVTRRLGPPLGMCWTYRRSPSHASCCGRVVCAEFGAVLEVLHGWQRR